MHQLVKAKTRLIYLGKSEAVLARSPDQTTNLLKLKILPLYKMQNESSDVKKIKEIYFINLLKSRFGLNNIYSKLSLF